MINNRTDESRTDINSLGTIAGQPSHDCDLLYEDEKSLLGNVLKKLYIFCSKIVLIAIQDAGSTYISSALNALKRLGVKDPILTDFRGSFALIGYTQPSKPSWITQEQQKRYEGPSEIFLRIPLKQSPQARKCIIILVFFSAFFNLFSFHDRENQFDQKTVSKGRNSS